MRAYVGEGRFTDDPLETFDGAGVMEIPRMKNLLRYICESGFEHHVGANFSTVGAAVREAATRYLGWDMYWHREQGGCSWPLQQELISALSACAFRSLTATEVCWPRRWANINCIVSMRIPSTPPNHTPTTCTRSLRQLVERCRSRAFLAIKCSRWLWTLLARQ